MFTATVNANRLLFLHLDTWGKTAEEALYISFNMLVLSTGILLLFDAMQLKAPHSSSGVFACVGRQQLTVTGWDGAQQSLKELLAPAPQIIVYENLHTDRHERRCTESHTELTLKCAVVVCLHVAWRFPAGGGELEWADVLKCGLVWCHSICLRIPLRTHTHRLCFGSVGRCSEAGRMVAPAQDLFLSPGVCFKGWWDTGGRRMCHFILFSFFPSCPGTDVRGRSSVKQTRFIPRFVLF